MRLRFLSIYTVYVPTFILHLPSASLHRLPHLGVWCYACCCGLCYALPLSLYIESPDVRDEVGNHWHCLPFVCFLGVLPRLVWMFMSFVAPFCIIVILSLSTPRNLERIQGIHITPFPDVGNAGDNYRQRLPPPPFDV